MISHRKTNMLRQVSPAEQCFYSDSFDQCSQLFADLHDIQALGEL